MQDETAQQSQDRQLMIRVAQGDQLAFSTLYDRLSGPLYSMAIKMLGDATEAEDALQEVSLQIWRRAASYDAAKSSVFSWAILLTRGKLIDRLRARGRRLRVVSASTDDDENKGIAAQSASSDIDTADTVNKKMRLRGCDRSWLDCRPNSGRQLRWHFFPN